VPGGSERVSALAVERGIYLLRYVSAANPAPLVFVRPSPGYESDVQFVSPPDDDSNILSQPHAFIVLRVNAPATIQVTVRARDGSSSCDPELKLEQLTERRVSEIFDRNPVGSSTEEAPIPHPETVMFALVAHIAMLGDVRVVAGHWAAGPSAPAQIEGLGVASEGSVADAIEYQVLAAGHRNWTPWAVKGQFLGSRGQKRPLVGLRLRLTDKAPDIRFDVEALFAGSRPLSLSGRLVELLGPSGTEALTGLKVEIIRNDRPSASSTVAEKPEQSPSRRVRVFRAPTSSSTVAQ
jgi:hypothetical protein